MGSDLALDLQNLKTAQSSFRYSFSFLPKVQRDALKTVYAFCRTTDDIVDNTVDKAKNLQRLKEWNAELEKAITGESSHQILNQLIGPLR